MTGTTEAGGGAEGSGHDPHSRRVAWERRVEVPMLVLAAVFLAAYAWPIVDPGLSRAVRRTLATVVGVTWALFVVDYVVRVVLSRDRGTYVRRHWYEIPVVVLPMLRPLRLLQLLVFLRVFNRSARNLSGRVATYVGAAAVMAVFLGALTVLDAERGTPGTGIDSFGNALWWSTVTVTTVGYGDLYPVTVPGRITAVVLMVFGIALIGALTATVAAWLVGQVEEEADVEQDEEDDARHAELMDELRQLRAELQAARGGPAPLGPVGDDGCSTSPDPRSHP